MFDVIPPDARGKSVGLMNMIGWLIGGGAAPVVIGLIAERAGLSYAISSAALAYVAGSALLLTGILFTINRDSARVAQM
jgi:sugar phosphate permease